MSATLAIKGISCRASRLSSPCGFRRKVVVGLGRCVRRPLLVRNTSEEAAGGNSTLPAPCYDPSLPFRTATQRLQELLEAVSWDSEEELLRHEVANQVPEVKLTVFVNLGSLLTLTALVTSWITGEDPLGGFAMSDASLTAIAAGAGYAVPLLLCSGLSRMRPVRHSFPVLEDLQDSQQELLRPIVEDLNPSQLLILASVLVVPSMLVLLPALHGTLAVAAQVLAADLLPAPPHGSALPHLLNPGLLPEGWLPGGWAQEGRWAPELPRVSALVKREAAALVSAVCSAYCAAWVVTRQLDVKDSQLAAIRAALGSADRYFLHAAAERLAQRPELLRGGAGGGAGGQQGGAQQGMQMQQQQQWGSGAGGPVVTSFASSGSGGMQLAGGVEEEEGEGGGSGGYNRPLRQLGEEMAAAFKMVSILWLLTRRRAARLGYVLTALNVAYFGIIWHHTRDLGAPVTAALLAVLAELFLIKHFPRGRTAQRGSDGSSGSGEGEGEKVEGDGSSGGM